MEEKHKVRGNRRQTRVYLGLGSNQGDRVGFIQQAIQLLKDNPKIRIIESSSLYETEPVGKNFSRSQWFINAVTLLETELTPSELLEICKEIELRLGRLNFAGQKPAGAIAKMESSKIIDLDILFYGNQTIETETLKIPHPKIQNSAYALVPLLEISPELVHPKFGKTISQLHEQLPLPELIYLYGTREEQE